MNKKSVKKFSRKYKKYFVWIIVGLVVLTLLGAAFYAQNSSKSLLKEPASPTISPDPTISFQAEVNNPTEIPAYNTYVSPVPTISSTPTPTAVPTTAEIRFIYVNKDDGNPIQGNGGRIEIKANDGSYDFGKDNVVEETVTGLKPTRHTLIMREPEGYTYYLFDLDNGNGTGFAAVNHCSVQLDPEPGRKLEARCLVKKN